MKELTSDRKSFDSPVRDVNRRLLVHDEEQLEGWGKYSIKIPNRIDSGEVPFLVDGC